MEYKVLLVEGNRLMLEQLAGIVKNTEGFTMAARYQDPGDALGQGAVFRPNLILLDVEHYPLTTLEDFKRVFPNTPILCLGDYWNAETASHVVQAGARGYLIKPFSGEDLKKAIDTFGKSGMETSSHVTAFFSPKGKSGKTTLIANLAMSLAEKSQQQVGIIDADLQFGDMSVFFNLEPRSTIVEAVRDVKFLSPLSLNGYFAPVNDRVHVLCGTKNPAMSDRVNIQAFEEIVNMAKSLFRYILIDIPPGFCPMSIAASELADSTCIVTMINGAYEIRHAQRALEIFKDWSDYRERVRMIFTRVSPCNMQAQQELSNFLEYPVDAILPNDYMAASTAADNGRMAQDIDPNSALTKNINLLAERIIHGDYTTLWRASEMVNDMLTGDTL